MRLGPAMVGGWILGKACDAVWGCDGLGPASSWPVRGDLPASSRPAPGQLLASSWPLRCSFFFGFRRKTQRNCSFWLCDAHRRCKARSSSCSIAALAGQLPASSRPAPGQLHVAIFGASQVLWPSQLHRPFLQHGIAAAMLGSEAVLEHHSPLASSRAPVSMLFRAQKASVWPSGVRHVLMDLAQNGWA